MERSMKKEKLKAPPIPCGSCPYRKDVPSGIWSGREYDKLPKYDGETWEQDPHVFMCHQRDGHLCGGWLACHKPSELLALRLQAAFMDNAVWEYTTNVPVFATGREAREHGIRDLDKPGPAAKKMVAGLMRKENEHDVCHRRDGGEQEGISGLKRRRT